jgi:hypothetical protein
MNSAPSCSQHNPTLRSMLSSINSLGCERLFTDLTPYVGKQHEALEWFWKHLDELDEEDKLTAATTCSDQPVQTSRPTAATACSDQPVQP